MRSEPVDAILIVVAVIDISLDTTTQKPDFRLLQVR